MSFERPEGSSEQPVREEKESELQRIRERVAEIKDALDEPVDEGIKEAVAMFNAMGLRTISSCEGHPERPRPGGKRPSLVPWIDVGPEEPDKPDWTEDERLREKTHKENMEYQRKAMDLLSEFYGDRKTPYDAMLGFAYGLGYWFRVESHGSEFIENLPKEEQREKIKLYKKEMDDFSSFLKEKYFEGEQG